MREGGWLVTARVDKTPLVAHGRTLEKARENIVALLAETLAVYPGKVGLDDVIGVSDDARKAVAAARQAKDAALRATAESAVATVRAAERLDAEHLSLRDIAYVLGISHSRVHQVLGRPEPTKGSRGK